MKQADSDSLIYSLAMMTLLAPFGAALADGGFLVRTAEEARVKVSSDAQKALVVWEAGTETLHVRSSFHGPVAEFAWVIPVPARPKVERSDWKLFTAAEQATRPEVVVVRTRFVHGGCTCASGAVPEQSAPQQTTVRRIESLDIRELHVEVLAADDAGGFVSWLKANGYAVGQSAEAVLGDYVRRRFFFVAVRVRETGFWARLKTSGGTVAGELTPLAISFPAAKPFYPLAISAISTAPENELLLLVAADRRLEAAEYPCVEMTSPDLERGISSLPWGKERDKALRNPDLALAVKAANQRLGRPTLVVEKVADMAWSGPEHRRFAPAKGRPGEQSARITRFHAILNAGEMMDVTFAGARENRLFEGQFIIDLDKERRGPRRTSAGLALTGLATTAALCGGPRRRRWLRCGAAGLLVAALCCL
jgi:hypothetical protein